MCDAMTEATEAAGGLEAMDAMDAIEAMAAGGYVLTMRGISKSFPGVQALQDVNFTLRAGEIHALVGENGAGKSTLIKVLTGVERMDQGTITLSGQEIQARSPQHAHQLGISTVYQEINLCPNLTVAENILIGREPRRWGRIHWKSMNAHAAQILQRLDIDIDVTQTLGSYSVAIQQMAAIARAIESSSAKILILDEPTSSLDAYETGQLFRVMRKLKQEGVAIVFITHFLDQIYEVADRITVLRNGKLVGTYDVQLLPRLELIAKMLGRNLTEFDEMARIKSEIGGRQGAKLIEADDLARAGSMEPFDLELYAGEVLGFAGLLGSGRTETAHLLFGVDKPDGGTLRICGEVVKGSSPNDSIRRGVALCPEDRKIDGIVDELSVRENIILALQANNGWLHHLGAAKQREIAERYIALLNIATPSPDQPVKNLSGGNQQKVILARWLATNSRVLILDEPTRGIDIGAKAEIQKLVLALADEGKGCIFISSELEEVMRCSHRIVVMRDREKVAEYPGGVDEEVIMQTMAGG
jgi:simple sugar transport system ATP-binding protein